MTNCLKLCRMTVTFRMSAGTEDTSGDYNSYDTVTENRIGEAIAGEDTSEEIIVTLKRVAMVIHWYYGQMVSFSIR